MPPFPVASDWSLFPLCAALSMLILPFICLAGGEATPARSTLFARLLLIASLSPSSYLSRSDSSFPFLSMAMQDAVRAAIPRIPILQGRLDSRYRAIVTSARSHLHCRLAADSRSSSSFGANFSRRRPATLGSSTRRVGWPKSGIDAARSRDLFSSLKSGIAHKVEKSIVAFKRGVRRETRSLHPVA